MTDHRLRDAARQSHRAVARTADEAASTAGSAYELASEIARDALAQARHSASDVLGAGHHYYRRGNRAVTRQIASQSIPTLLLIAGVSFALGWFARDIQKD